MKLGMISDYTVLRKTEIGYILGQDDAEFFLHNNECAGRSPAVGTVLAAFLYLDKKKRPALTLATPHATLAQAGFAEVVAVTEAGAFCDIGISRDILFSADDFSPQTAPQVGDILFVRLKTKGTQLLIKLAGKADLAPAFALVPGDQVTGFIYRITRSGLGLVTRTGEVCFIPASGYRFTPRYGQAVAVRITAREADGYLATALPPKRAALKAESAALLALLQARGGKLACGDKTSPAQIKQLTGLSKAAFKRAVGQLYKAGLVAEPAPELITLRPENF